MFPVPRSAALTDADLSPGLILIHGNQAESLRDLLVTWMKRHPLAPLETEVVLVQSNGIAQWLKFALAADAGRGGCGIAAGLSFSLPSRFLWQAYRAVLGRDAVPEVSPFDETLLQWRLMRILPTLGVEPVYRPLQRFLDDDADLRKRFQLAERVADLYDQYQVYRADWLAAWARGEDVLIDARGGVSPLPEEQRWQAALWRHLHADIGAARPATGGAARAAGGRATVHEAFLERARALADAPRPPALPRRVLVFGISALPRQSLEVLAALAQWSQVLMCVHNPCEHYWADIVSGQDLLRARASRQARKPGSPPALSEEALHLHAHPLLAAWGKQGRDTIALLDEHDDPGARAGHQRRFAAIGERIDLFVATAGATLLQQIQDDIRALRPLPEIRRLGRTVDPAGERSLCFHVAHSRQREVEILHDQLLAAFDADPGLRPRDVIVMVPDIDAYAPHIQAVFGLDEPHDRRFIPFSLADQGPRRIDPLLHALEHLLGLPQSRLAVSDVLDLLEVPALRARFGLAADDVPVLHRWIRGANIRWGLHGEQRAHLALPDAGEAAPNSWLFGLRRMLLGYAAGAEAAPWQGIEPYGEIGGLDAALLGPLAVLLARLDDAWRMLRTPATPRAWGERLRALLAHFFAPAAAADAYTLSRLDAALQRWLDACDEAALDEPLPLAVVAGHWLDSVDDGGLGQRFFAGAVTFATLMPMRAIPFRHICLLGMNDGDYPRTREPLDFDLMGRDYRPGDRSRREDDRYLFLEALLSARERLYVSWVGRSINDNTERPPSVLVGQLRDHLGAGWRLAGDEASSAADAARALLAALTVEHPLQPFSMRYFAPDPAASALFTYAHEWRRSPLPASAAGAAAGSASLPPMQREEPLSVGELADFLHDPVKAFFRRRLGVAFEHEDPASTDVEPFVLDGLQKWQLQDELITAQADALARAEAPAAAREACLGAIRRRGELAAGAFGERLATELAEPMEALFDAYTQALARWPRNVEGEFELRFEAVCDGVRLELADWLGGLRCRDGDGGDEAWIAQGATGGAVPAASSAVIVLEPSDLVKDRHYRGEKLIRHWVRHLAWQCARGAVTTVVVSKKGVVALAPLEAAAAAERLRDLLAAWQDGMGRPLPLAVRTAFAWLRARPGSVHGGEEERGDGEREDGSAAGKALAAARTVYEGGYGNDGELGASPYLRRAFPDFDALVGGGEFQALAEHLLRPLHDAIHSQAAEEGRAGTEARRGRRQGGDGGKAGQGGDAGSRRNRK